MKGTSIKVERCGGGKVVTMGTQVVISAAVDKL